MTKSEQSIDRIEQCFSFASEQMDVEQGDETLGIKTRDSGGSDMSDRRTTRK